MAELNSEFIGVSYELDESGLVWHPEIGDEVVQRSSAKKISILVDPQGMTPSELRQTFVWLPTVEQLVSQIEAREGLLYHAGISESMDYEAVIKTGEGLIEISAPSLRLAFGLALNDLLVSNVSSELH